MQLDDSRLFQQDSYMNGQWCAALNGARFKVSNPANGLLLAQVADLGVQETQRAIDAAKQALPNWRAQTGKARGQLLRRWYELIVAHADDLGRLMTAEQGKPFFEARGEALYAASFVEWYAEEARRIRGDTLDSPLADKRLIVLKQAVGVCAAITPWNFPAAMITRKVAPALAAGCTVIVKPAEQTPLTALALAELAQRAGFPAGVLNVITASATSAPQIGQTLCQHPDVRKLSFTGSTAIGKLLYGQCADTVKKISFELGGNAPFIVFDDADLDVAVEAAMQSKYRNNGQTCICANRLLIQDGIYEAFATRFAERVKMLKVGDGMAEGTHLGPLIDQAALNKVEELLADALAQGAHVLSGGQAHRLGGTFFEPTVLTDVKPTMRCAQEEIFGPLAPLFRFKTEEEAIALANQTEYGLAGYFFSRDIQRVWRVAEALDYGMVGINTASISNEAGPFGGIKQSGLGREGSRYGMEEYLELKYLCLGL